MEEPEAALMLKNVQQYFTSNAIIVHPMLNSPPSAGREGVAASYRMLRCLTIGNKIEFHACAFDRVVVRKGVEHQVGLLDLTESLYLRFLPWSPKFNIRFLGELAVFDLCLESI